MEKMNKEVLLFGGFSGWLNWGDILQFKSWLIFYRERGFKIKVLLNRDCLSNSLHYEILKRVIKEDFIFYDKGKFYDSQLNPLDKVKIDFFHVYGGGFLNPYWGKNKLEIIERTMNFFRPKKYFITGQQLSKEFLPYLKNHLDIYKPDLLAVRDRESLELCSDRGIDAFFSFDDSTEYLSLLRKSIDNEPLKADNKKTLFLHLNLSYYTLKQDSEIWSYREKLKKVIDNSEKLYLVKTYQSYNTEVKDTLRAVEYIYLTMEKAEGNFLDLVTMLINEDFAALKNLLTSGVNPLAISNSYHTAFFFAFLGIPSYLLRLNPYYEQKGKEIFEEIDLEGVWSNIEEIKAKQQIKLKELLKERKKFIDDFEKQLFRDSDVENKRVYDKFTYLYIPEIMIEKTEIDDYVKQILNDLNWFKKELEKILYQLDRLKNKTEVLEADLEKIKWERDNLKTALERIYSSRGWRFLTVYYKIKHKVFASLGLIKDENR